MKIKFEKETDPKCFLDHHDLIIQYKSIKKPKYSKHLYYKQLENNIYQVNLGFLGNRLIILIVKLLYENISKTFSNVRK